MMRDILCQDARIEALRQLLEADERFCTAVLFGSAATGRCHAASDIDVGVVYRDAQARTSVEAELLLMLGRLGVAAGAEIHLVDLEEVGHVLRFQVFRDGRLLFDRDPRRTARLLERTLTERFDWLHAMSLQDEIESRRAATWTKRKVSGG